MIKRIDGKTVLVTGGLGFVGSSLARKCLDLGARVILLSRSRDNLENIAGIENRVSIVVGNIADKDAVYEAVKNKDYIFHLAGQTSHKISMANPFLDLESNCLGTLNILEACRQLNSNAEIVFSGTVREAGPIANGVANENQRENPVTIYDLHKLTAEKYLQVYNQNYGLRTTTLRITNVFGPGQRKTNPDISIINHIIKRAVDTGKLTIYNDGGVLRDYNYVENVTDAFVMAAQSEETKGEYYIVGSGIGRTFRDFIADLKSSFYERGMSLKIDEVETPKEVGQLAQGDVVADYSKFAIATGWEPETCFKDGLNETIDFYAGERK